MVFLTLAEASKALERGEVIAHPTEGVYGFAADASNKDAVKKVLMLKKRSPRKGFIVLIDALERIEKWIEPLSQLEEKLLLEHLDSGFRHTWVVPASKECPPYLLGQYSSLALRVTNFLPAKALCQAFSKPLISTSVNISGEPPFETAEAINAIFKGEIAGVLTGKVGPLQHPTKIIDLKSGQYIR